MLKKSSSKFISIKIILLIIGFLIFFMLAYITAKYINPEIEKELNEVNNVYYSKFNETFLGIIISIQDERRQFKGGPHLAMLKLKLLHTTVKNYDIRDSTMNYFCVINYPYAEVFCHTGVSRNIELGDTCYYNGKNDTLWIFSNKENIW
ncbi:MAG: hypothetical protein GY756_27780, partial [bacterium]|nr:hypothetical protein [bacterium]